MIPGSQTQATQEHSHSIRGTRARDVWPGSLIQVSNHQIFNISYIFYMDKKFFTNKHYNTPGHAHELTFSVYRRRNLFTDIRACEMLVEEIVAARQIFSLKLWAYVIMPNHVHLLLWPMESTYDMGKIVKTIKGRMAKRYIHDLKETGQSYRLDEYRAIEKGITVYRIWQRGGGFDRNLWNAEPIYKSIRYIEANPVRKKLAKRPEEWRWGSAYARVRGAGLLPDESGLPVRMLDVKR